MKQYHICPIAMVTNGRRDMSHHTYRMNYGQPLLTATYAWYIDGPELKILVDTGCTADIFHAHGSQTEEDVQSLEEGLDKLGLKPEDIDIVILTHLHFDHVALANKFHKAKFIAQKVELDFALKPHVLASFGYDQNLIEDLKLDLIQGDKEIVEGVRILLTPGHTPGGQSVMVETPKGIAAIPGFCCVMANFEPPPSARARGLEVAAPGSHTDALQAYDSALRIKRTADIILAAHDVSFVGIDRIP